MEDFKKRMFEELMDLQVRIGKLYVALNKEDFKKKVGETQYKLMQQQHKGMKIYLEALTKRCEDLGIIGIKNDMTTIIW